ncbi:WecB/TagA/CpsF family glycosyltransferase [Gloeocapsopsis dulcis]|uniref:Glycosyltransferase n=1 Tax=Gloeocapsopsis dulcis AAB1 = 1H9 TaxID=1433147 RepID=A0A6N8G3J2_9CHRO|nr:WecB/TagA/CpsF family glycosyltransferase [Gloeocapsopsis dulcis]MUL39035.1 glycosyltransferase [Gloeocapsopsis dulcis AAB1 = 1H9]WNN90556.1 WecB/TagA/CpsF family glycosyltransferase [Gloeocapsopsis dulcis]
MKVDICGVEIDRCTFDKAVETIISYALSANEPRYVVTPNAQHILLLQENTRFCEVYEKAFLVVADGVPLVWASKFLGRSLPGRVNGTDLFERLCQEAAKHELKVFLLGGRPGSAKGSAQVLQQKHPGLKIVDTYCPPYSFETDSAEIALINEKIRAATPHLLFVALGAPKQEYWIYDNYQEIEVPISIGIGASFEFVSGMIPRAPLWMQKSGLEWFFRLVSEPKRLWQRYILGNPHFMWLVFKQRLGVLRSN